MVDGPVVDSHVHLWDPRRFRMHWLDVIPDLRRRFERPEFAEEAAGLPIQDVVYV